MPAKSKTSSGPYYGKVFHPSDHDKEKGPKFSTFIRESDRNAVSKWGRKGLMACRVLVRANHEEETLELLRPRLPTREVMRSRHPHIASLAEDIDKRKIAQMPESEIVKRAPHETGGLVLTYLRPYLSAADEPGPQRVTRGVTRASAASAAAAVDEPRSRRVTRSMTRAAAAPTGITPATETPADTVGAPASTSVGPETSATEEALVGP